MSYVLDKLLPLGFTLVRGDDKEVALKLNHLILLFECSCPHFPIIKAMGCPLHHEGDGGSAPVIQALRYRYLLQGWFERRVNTKAKGDCFNKHQKDSPCEDCINEVEEGYKKKGVSAINF